MRYYDLDINGKVKGSYAVEQPDKTLHLLEDAPNDDYKRDGVPGKNWIPDADKVVPAKLAEVNAIREAKIAAGIPFMFPDGAGTIQTRNAIDARNILTNVSAATSLFIFGETKPVMVFRDEENVEHKMTPRQMMEMGIHLAQQGQIVYSASWTLGKAAEEMTATEIAAFDVAANWPK